MSCLSLFLMIVLSLHSVFFFLPFCVAHSVFLEAEPLVWDMDAILEISMPFLLPGFYRGVLC